MRYLYLILVFSSLLTTTLRSQAQPPYEQVLAPFDTIVADAGVRWSAELRVRNSSEVQVNLFPDQCSWIGLVTPCETKIIVPPQTTKLVDVLNSSSLHSPGLLLYVPSTHVDDVTFSLTVRDSRSEDAVGTTIPVVRSRDFRSRFTIPGIPVSLAHRRTLRVYEPHWPVQSVFRVRVIDETTNVVLVEREYLRGLPTDPPSPLLVPATFDFSDSLSAVALGDAEHVSVVVERVFPEQLVFWPLVSVTSNLDNRVAVYAPN